MPSGGARARSAPPPDPNSIRQDRKSAQTWTHLASSPRTDPAPAWPLPTASPRERVLWRAEWRRPQAAMWLVAGQEKQVALYVRTFAEAELPNAKPDTRVLVLRMEEYLGVSLAGMARNRWIIDAGPAVPRVKTTDAARRTSSKAKFQTIDGGAPG